ncbi:glycosyltransferase [Actinoplanes missouriensis]|uniref:glycosyltransferase n=1 Tax=Actinoplanes missouriensis TaxID=1866 RepID=UPI0036C1E46D
MSRITGLANRSLEAYRLRNEMRRRQPPQLRYVERGTGEPTIYYLAPDLDAAVGGIRVIYRHVDALNALGLRARVLHGTSGFRSTWFEHSTPVVYAADAELTGDDVIVVPEWYGPTLDRLPAWIPMVVFNQRAYDTWDFVPYESTPKGSPYAGFGNLKALLTVSRDNADLLEFAFPDVPVHRVRNVIDADIFHAGTATPSRRISFTTTRREREREQLLHVLRSRGVLDGWDVVPIVNRSETEVADIMRDSAIFLSFSDREGFGLPPAEAMACGSYVVGYPGLAGREFFDPAYCAPVAENDLLAFARAVETACASYDDDPLAFSKAGRVASERVLSEYAPERLDGDLVAFFEPLTNRRGIRR